VIPRELTVRSFERYPPQGRAFASSYLSVLQRLPIAVLVSFLDQIIGWDWRFPAERNQLEAELGVIKNLSTNEFEQLTQPFAKIALPTELTHLDWINAPPEFLERFTAYLWSSHQIDGYRAAARLLLEQVSAQIPPANKRRQPLVVVTCTKDLVAADYPLFLKLRKYGLYAMNIQASNGDEWISELLSRRSAEEKSPYAHWFLDGGITSAFISAKSNVVYLSYEQAEPVRSAVLNVMASAVRSGWGPEVLRLRLTQLRPSDCNAEAITEDPILQHFIVSLLADGSGTQIYTTSFVQWSAREILRRAQPDTLIVRITPRVRQRSLNDFVSGRRGPAEPDFRGSLIDGDLAAYYTWLELRKLPGAEQSVFLAWFPGPRQALLIAPDAPKNVDTPNSLSLNQLLALGHLDT